MAQKLIIPAKLTETANFLPEIAIKNINLQPKICNKKIVTEVICNHAIVVYTESHLQEALST